jgi:hypothetical protein
MFEREDASPLSRQAQWVTGLRKLCHGHQPARRLAALLNRRKFYLEAPSPFQGIQTRQGEAGACGTRPWGSKTEPESTIPTLRDQLHCVGKIMAWKF